MLYNVLNISSRKVPDENIIILDTVDHTTATPSGDCYRNRICLWFPFLE